MVAEKNKLPNTTGEVYDKLAKIFYYLIQHVRRSASTIHRMGPAI
jgi:hypothetical protein